MIDIFLYRYSVFWYVFDLIKSESNKMITYMNQNT